MKEQEIKKKQEGFPFTKLFADMVRGGCVGSVSATAMTPIMNFTNQLLHRQAMRGLLNQGGIASNLVPKFTLGRAFDGVLAYNASVVPMVGVSLSLNTFFLSQIRQRFYEPNEATRLGSATLSGMIAGAFGALPAGIAQVQQLTTPKPRALAIAGSVIKHNGFFALGRGAGPTMIRQGIITVGFMGLMPYLTSHVREKIGSPLIADLFSAGVCGLIMGPVTTPWNTLRFERQKHFENAGPAPSYSSIVRRAFTPNSGLNLMAGWRPRILMSACSMFLLFKGKEIYDKVSSRNEANSVEMKPK